MMKLRLLCPCAIVIVLGAHSPVCAQACAPYWAQAPVPVPGFFVRELVTFDDGTGPALYGVIGNLSWKEIYRWNGRQWEHLSAGLPLIDVAWLRVLDDGNGARLHVIVGRRPSQGGWQSFVLGAGGVWEPGPPGLVTNGSGPGDILEFPDYSFDDGSGMAIYGQVMVVPFQTSAPAKWNGAGWDVLGGPANFGGVKYIGFDDGTGQSLYAAGEFHTIGGVAANRIARWDGSTWHPLGTGPVGNRSCRELAVIESGPAAGLYYLAMETVNGPNYIQKWDGQQWTVLPPPSAPPFTTYTANWIAAFDDGDGPAIYLGGTFSYIGGFLARGLARWDGFAWSPVGGGTTSGGVSGFGVFEDDPRGPSLFVVANWDGGPMVVGGGDVPSGLAQWVGCPNCYANCDVSATEPRLNVDDFTCFINKFAARDPYANCDRSTTEPIFTVDDFTCFINAFAQGCP